VWCTNYKVDTPIEPYNPDWEIIKQEDRQNRIYMICGTKRTIDDSKLCPTELIKTKTAKPHFEAIGVDDYAGAVPRAWRT
jgi:type III restriction enzyme